MKLGALAKNLIHLVVCGQITSAQRWVRSKQTAIQCDRQQNPDHTDKIGGIGSLPI